MYAELGVAQADLVQAGCCATPCLTARSFFPLRRPGELGTQCRHELSRYFLLPLRKRVAAARFEDGQVPGDRGGARFCRHGPGGVLPPPGRRADGSSCSRRLPTRLPSAFEVAQRLHAAGNITDLDLRAGAGDRRRGKSATAGCRDHGTGEPGAAQHADGALGTRDRLAHRRRLPDLPAEPLSAGGARGAGASARALTWQAPGSG